ncbi:MAG: S46 family peptidase [Kofleriaceae bacterium]|nr:S46 family peptidase [Kofleriaceae bacterium]MCB9574982.1 S46 family peptidase [Kofleriaceae bacterium]
MKRKTLLASLLLAAACGGTQQPTGGGTGGGDTGGGAGTGTASGGGDTAAPVDPHLAAREAYQDPGGMWMPRQMLEQAKQLQDLGLQIDAAALSDPTKPPLSSVVDINGCTASFVSADGLIVTNHHCAQGALQINSTAEHDIINPGFLAKTRADELSAGPGQRVRVAQKMTDVTKVVRDGLDKLKDGNAVHDAIDQREKQLKADCEKDRPAIRCEVSSFFGGAEWQLTEYLEIRDIRLVYVPDRTIGDYGGEIDNWEWPRHTGDYSFFRAYVGKDGKPAEYSTDNVPYHPASHLTIGVDGVKPHDLVMVTGYPGRTNREQLSAELRHAMEWTEPRYIEKAQQRMDILAELQKQGGDTALKAGVTRQFVQNGLEKYQGILEGLKSGELVRQKEAEEKAFRTWAAADPSRAKYLDALNAVEAAYDAKWAEDAKQEAWVDVAFGSSMLREAVFLARWTEERQKPDAERKQGFQDRDLKNVMANEATLAKRYDATIDRAFFRMALTRAAAQPEAERPWLGKLLGLKKGKKVDDKAIDKALDGWFKGTKLLDPKVREGLMKSTPKQVAKSKDPFVKLAMMLLPDIKKMEKEDEAFYGQMALVYPVYVEGLLASKGGLVAPDANRTLRISYGTVRGYKRSPDAEMYDPFTNVLQIPKKDTGEDPFNAPKKLLDAISAGKWGPYASADAGGVVPVNFLSDLDITGGNSGSPVLDAKGQLIGLAFDGNKEGLASDVVFNGENTRTISCDIRYVLWLMDAVDHADALLEEMGVKPQL